MELLTRTPRPPGGEPVSDPGAEDTAVSSPARVRVLLAAALGPLVTGYAAVATLLAMVTLTAGRTTFSGTGVLLAAGPGWLAAHQVRLGIGGHPLGVLPLLPTIGAVLLAARTAAGAAQRLGCRSPREALPVLITITGAHSVFGLVIAVLAHGSPVTANPLLAFAVPGLFAGLAAAGGIAAHCGLPGVVTERLDPMAVRGLRAGALGLATLVLCGAAVFTVATTLSWPVVDDMFEPAFGSSFGLFLLSVLYLPNAVVAALSFIAGPGFSVGSLNVGMFGYRGGAVPGLPILGGLPEHHSSWWPALLVLPALTGALVGWSLRRVDDDPAVRIRTVAVAGALVGFGCVVLGTLSGGRLGDGPFDPVRVPVGVASVVAFCWIVIPGSFVAFFAGVHAPPAPPDALDLEVGEEPEASEDAEAAEDSEETEEAEATDEDSDAEASEEPDEAEAAEATEAVEDDEESEVDDAPDSALSRESAEATPDAPADDPAPPEDAALSRESAEPADDVAGAVTESTEPPGDDTTPENDR